MTQAVIYTRFSPRRRASECESCRTQEALCRAYAAKKGWEVRSVHSDEGISGSKVYRPGLEDALCDLEPHDVFLVYTRDRMARNLYLAELLRRRVKGSGARIVAASGDVGDGEEETPETILARQILDSVAEYALAQNASRTRHAMQVRQAAGERMSRYPPLGMQADPEDPNRWIPHPEELLAIKKMHRMSRRGMNAYAIAKRLDRTMPKVRRGKRWSIRTVKRVLARGA